MNKSKSLAQHYPELVATIGVGLGSIAAKALAALEERLVETVNVAIDAIEATPESPERTAAYKAIYANVTRLQRQLVYAAETADTLTRESLTQLRSIIGFTGSDEELVAVMNTAFSHKSKPWVSDVFQGKV